MGAIRKNTRYCQFTESQAGDGKARGRRIELRRFAKVGEMWRLW
jgi:hypothetical protein